MRRVSPFPRLHKQRPVDSYLPLPLVCPVPKRSEGGDLHFRDDHGHLEGRLERDAGGVDRSGRRALLVRKKLEQLPIPFHVLSRDPER